MNRLLQLAELAFIALLITWFVLDLLDVSVNWLFIISMTGMASVFFLQFRTPLEIDLEGEETGFKELLGLTIIPKVLGISSSVALVGILFHQLGMEGSANMLVVGSLSIAVAAFLWLVLKLAGTKHIELLFPRLAKALLILGVAIYLMPDLF